MMVWIVFKTKRSRTSYGVWAYAGEQYTIAISTRPFLQRSFEVFIIAVLRSLNQYLGPLNTANERECE